MTYDIRFLFFEGVGGEPFFRSVLSFHSSYRGMANELLARGKYAKTH